MKLINILQKVIKEKNKWIEKERPQKENIFIVNFIATFYAKKSIYKIMSHEFKFLFYVNFIYFHNCKKTVEKKASKEIFLKFIFLKDGWLASDLNSSLLSTC